MKTLMTTIFASLSTFAASSAAFGLDPLAFDCSDPANAAVTANLTLADEFRFGQGSVDFTLDLKDPAQKGYPTLPLHPYTIVADQGFIAFVVPMSAFAATHTEAAVYIPLDLYQPEAKQGSSGDPKFIYTEAKEAFAIKVSLGFFPSKGEEIYEEYELQCAPSKTAS